MMSGLLQQSDEVSIFTWCVKGQVDSVGGAIVVRPQRRLLIGPVSYDEVHQRPGRLK